MNTPISPDTPALPFPATKRARGRSLSDFAPLAPAEKKLLVCCATGEEARIGNSVPIDDSDRSKIVRANFLRFLLLGGDEQAPIHEKGVQLIGARIEGKLKIQNCVLPHGITLLKCRVVDRITAFDAHIVGPLVLSGSNLLQGLRADRLRCDSGVFLRDDFLSLSEVSLMGAQIGGDLDCESGRFESKADDALSADGVIVKGGVYLSGRFKVTGTVRLLNAQLGRDLICSGGQFVSKKDAALVAHGIVVKGSVYLSVGFKATGEVTLCGAQIEGNLACSGGQFMPVKGDAFNADRIRIKGSVTLNQGFKATGEVRLLGAQLGGNLICSGGHFAHENGYALTADGIVVKGFISLEKGFKANGAVRFLGAHVDNHLVCRGAFFAASSETALYLQTAVIKGGFHLRGLVAPVRIDATSAQLGVLADDCSAWAKDSILDGLVYKSLSGRAPTDAATRIEWLKKQSAEDLGGDTLKRNFRPQPWKQLQKVLREMGHDADAREVGVAYEDQLRKADRIGQITNVKNVNRWIPFLRRKCLRALHWLFGFLAGYGYHPLRLFMSLVGVWLFCGVIYWWLAYAPHSAIGPTDPLVFQNTAYSACAKENNGNWMLCEQLPAEYTTFSPLAYSLDILLPLVDLGQEKRWGPLIPTPENNFCVELLSLSPPHWVRLLNWFQILYGWIASLLFVAIVSGTSRRSEMDK